ncbi:MAG: PQQ-dependent sugar dehydrogenase [Chloroflexota bacterium]
MRTARRSPHATRAGRWVLGLAILASCAVATPGNVVAQSQPITLSIGSPVATGLRSPVLLTHAGDGSGRRFIIEQRGAIRILTSNGTLLTTPFLDVSATVSSVPNYPSTTEQGLLGLAFHPSYGTNGKFYIFYTDRTTGANTVACYTVSGDPNVANPGGTVMLAILDFAGNHNAGGIAFGPDGYLYVATGDGGGGGDPNENGQSLTALLGKFLRIDINNSAGCSNSYAIPASNPFVGQAPALPEIWSYGWRNPYRWSFDRLTGDIYVGDVGQNLFEEISFQAAGTSGGKNFGWDVIEGSHCFNEANFTSPLPNCNTSGMTPPAVEYSHSLGCSVTGGYVYRGALSPALYGMYLYGDYCSGRIWGLRRSGGARWSNAMLLDTNLAISSFGEDEAGEVYVVRHGNSSAPANQQAASGEIYRLSATSTSIQPGHPPRGGSVGGTPDPAPPPRR